MLMFNEELRVIQKKFLWPKVRCHPRIFLEAMAKDIKVSVNTQQQMFESIFESYSFQIPNRSISTASWCLAIYLYK
jgi:hypothetical protein